MGEMDLAERLTEETMEDLKKISCTTCWGVLGSILKNPMLRDAYRMMDMKPIDVSYKICGPAVTVRYLPLNPLNPTSEEKELLNKFSNMITKMTEAITPGSVLVLAALGRKDAGIVGDGMCFGYKSRGAAGLVVDGGVRDLPVIRSRVKLQIFMSGRPTPTASGWHMHDGKIAGVLPQEINVPVVCDGVLVNPGDIIIGDEAGIMVIPIEYVEKIAEIGGAIEDIEDLERKLIVEGKLFHGEKLTEEILKEHGLLEKWRILRAFREF